MDLFERYIHAVRTFLPNAQREDVVRELSEDLRAAVEEREAELGRPLDESEQEQIIRQWGHPLVLASRYQPQRQLVGPVLFPIYWFVLRVALVGALVINVVAGAIFLANGKPVGEVIRHIALLPFGPLLMVFAWVTAIFAIFDRQMPKLPFIAQWSPRSLPAIPPAPGQPTRWALLFEIALTTAFVLWLAAAPRQQWLVFGPAWSLFELGPTLLAIHVPLVIVACGNLVVLWINFVHPEWMTLRTSTRIVTSIVTVGLLGFAASAGDMVVLERAAGADAERLLQVVNLSARLGIAVTAVVAAVEAAIDIVRLFGGSHVRQGWSSRVQC